MKLTDFYDKPPHYLNHPPKTEDLIVGHGPHGKAKPKAKLVRVSAKCLKNMHRSQCVMVSCSCWCHRSEL